MGVRDAKTPDKARHNTIREAIITGPEAVRAFLKQNDQFLGEVLSVQGEDDTADTALMYAVERGDPAVVQAILEGMNRLPPEEREAILHAMPFTETGRNALHIASERGNPEIVAMLIDAGSNVDGADMIGSRPLYHAIKNGHVDAAKELIAAGAKVNGAVNGDNQTALQVAARTGNLEMVKLLMASGAEPMEKNPPALAYASSREVADFLINDARKHNVAIEPSVLLATEARIGNAGKVEEILKKHPDALAKAFPNRISGKLLFEDLVERGNTDVLKIIAVRGGNNVPDEALFNILLEETVAKGDIAKLKRLAELGGKDILRGTQRYDPLEAAAANGDVEMAKAIIDMRGAGFDNSNQLALMAAVDNGKAEMVTVLVEKLGGKDFLMKQGAPALSSVANSGDIAMLNILAQQGGKDFVAQEGEFALKIAAGNGDGEMVKALIALGGDPLVKRYAQEAIKEAAKNGHSDVVEYLQRQQARIGATEKHQDSREIPGEKPGKEASPVDNSPEASKQAVEAARKVSGQVVLTESSARGTPLASSEHAQASRGLPTSSGIKNNIRV